MLGIYICDDECVHLTAITDMIDKHILSAELPLRIEASVSNPHDLLDAVARNDDHAGIYFLDYDLKRDDVHGIQLAEQIRKLDPRGFIIFITADANAHRLTFKHRVEALDYIIKGEDDLNVRIGDCLHNAVEKYNAKVTSPLKDNFVLVLSDEAKDFMGKKVLSKKSTVSIENNKIFYFSTNQYFKRVVTVSTTEGQLQFNGTLSQVEQSMDAMRFYRVQNNLIVNLAKVVAIDKENKAAVLANGAHVEIAAKQLPLFIKTWEQYQQGK